jgi:hypothetical protein
MAAAKEEALEDQC